MPFKTWRLSVGCNIIELNEDTRIVHWDDNRCGYRVLWRKPGHYLTFLHRDYNTYLEALVSVL